MRVLFLHPTPGFNNHRSYSEACALLQERGHQMVLTYNGPEVSGLDPRVPAHCFNTWFRANESRVVATDLLELERRYPASNLFLGIVSERRTSNYSLLDGTYPHPSYTFDELNLLTKALVLYYEELLERYQIETVFAHHPDNIHSTILFEMLLSRSESAYLIFPDYYWSQETNFLFDAKYFTSKLMLEHYQRNLAEYEQRVLPREAEIQKYISDRSEKDPSKVRPDLFPKASLTKSLSNGLDVLRKGKSQIYFRKPHIVYGYSQVYFWASLKAFFLRQIYARTLRWSSILAEELPREPFVFFPFQRVPEAAMLTRATSYLNQQGLVQAISASLPSGYKIVVKDHPRSTGYNKASYYAKLLELPNVVVLKPGFPNQEILAKTELVLTIAGTLGYQQLMQGKPVVVFGRKFYECLEGVIRIDDMNQLPYILKDILLFGKHIPDPTQMRRSLLSYFATLLDHKYQAGADAYKLHSNPVELAKLVGDMLERDIVPGMAQ